MQILTAAEMAACDRSSVGLGVSVAELMQQAGTAVANFILRAYPDAGVRSRISETCGGPIVVLCGRGNNGGDGIVSARVLAQNGREVCIGLLGHAAQLSDNIAALLAKAEASDVKLTEIANESELAGTLRGASLVVDAVLGTGFKPPLRDLALAARSLLSKNTVPIVAIDLPSGWDADSTAEVVEGAFRSDAVVTFVAPKPAHLFGQLTTASMGSVVVASIGTPAAALPEETSSQLRWAGAAKSLTENPRPVRSNKGTYGHVLVVGGSLGKAGAPSMSSLAALKAGAGLVTAAVPQEILSTVATGTPELMLVGLGASAPHHEDSGLALDHLHPDLLRTLLKGSSVVAIGPGLGQAGSTPEWVRQFVKSVSLPMVVDADALNAFAGHSYLLTEAVKMSTALGEARTLVLTPHPGEMARLTGLTIQQIQSDRIGVARQFATEHGVTLVLKGSRTLVAHPNGQVGVNTSGNPAMAKGGSGDILTGIIAATLAQYANAKLGQLTSERVALAVESAVFLHGLAGDFAALNADEHTVLATETVAHLWRAFRSRVKDAHGLIWLTGTAAQTQSDQNRRSSGSSL